MAEVDNRAHGSYNGRQSVLPVDTQNTKCIKNISKNTQIFKK